MNDAPLDILPAERLARLLDLEQRSSWSEEDAAAALRHQLRTTLLPDLLTVGEVNVQALAEQVGDRTFVEVLAGGGKVPREWLMAVKGWAKQLREREGHPLAGGPATVIYYAAIARAVVQREREFTQLSPAQLREGFEWSGKQAGGEVLRGLFEEALVKVRD
jgi:hypothetical protein